MDAIVQNTVFLQEFLQLNGPSTIQKFQTKALLRLMIGYKHLESQRMLYTFNTQWETVNSFQMRGMALERRDVTKARLTPNSHVVIWIGRIHQKTPCRLDLGDTFSFPMSLFFLPVYQEMSGLQYILPLP